MASLAAVLPTVRGEFSKLKVPGPHDKVYNDECMYSFDSPFSDTGLYVNMSTWMGYGEDFYLQDAVRTGNKLYVHLKWMQVPLVASATSAASSSTTASVTAAEEVTKLAIGVGGGFVTEAKYDIVKEHALVVICDGGPQRVSLPHAELPEFVSNVAQAIVEHNGMKSKMQVDSWDASNDVVVSKYAAALIQLPADRKISQDPSTWRCEMSGEKENLWLNLSTGYAPHLAPAQSLYSPYIASAQLLYSLYTAPIQPLYSPCTAPIQPLSHPHLTFAYPPRCC